MVRQRGRETDYLVLADSPVVLDVGHEPLAFIDETEKIFAAELDAVARGGSSDDLARFIHDQQNYRNRAGGYWVAQVAPEAGEHALSGTVENVRGALLASDGAALMATEFGVLDWRGLLDLAYRDGPDGLIAATRQLEDSDPERTKWPRYKVRDDASAAVMFGMI